jgi:ferrous iron transport protein A
LDAERILIGTEMFVSRFRDFIQKGKRTMQTLREVSCGNTVTVVRLHGEGAVKRRIMDMGITKGTSVYVRKVAPLGDPVEVTVRGYELSLRKADAEMIEVK